MPDGVEELSIGPDSGLGVDPKPNAHLVSSFRSGAEPGLQPGLQPGLDVQAGEVLDRFVSARRRLDEATEMTSVGRRALFEGRSADEHRERCWY